MTGASILRDVTGDSMDDAQRAGVIRFYDTHPINEDEILAKLAADGVALTGLTQAQLAAYDQDHYGGVQVVDELATAAGIDATQHVLDVCSGMGGPARWLAHRIGCRVTGIDLTRSRVDAAARLSERVGLAGQVGFVHGDATAMPFASGAFDVAIGQEAWLHIPDKQALVGECVRVVRAGGTIAFTDVVARVPLSDGEAARMAAEMQAPDLPSADEYERLLTAAGCRVAARTDLSARWCTVLRERLAMYRSLRDTTVAKFGEARYLAYDSLYAFFVGLFEAGRLGGVRMVARVD